MTLSFVTYLHITLKLKVNPSVGGPPRLGSPVDIDDLPVDCDFGAAVGSWMSETTSTGG